MKRFLLARKRRLIYSIQPSAICKGIHARLFTLKTTLFITFIFLSVKGFGQSSENTLTPEFRKTLTDRSVKIVNTLEIKDSVKYYRVVENMVNQYAALNAIHDQYKLSVADIKKQGLADQEKTDAIKIQEEKKSTRLLQLHQQFIAQLKGDLTDKQLDQIKDGMTYRVFPITYTAYLDMLPNLTGEQKDKIHNWLEEARELAMDEGSSDDKHKVFGKYKGRINNYLSAAGYDMKKEGEAWQQRIKEKKALSSNPAN